MPKPLREIIGEALGEASVCWSEGTQGTFQTERVMVIQDRVMAAIESSKDAGLTPGTDQSMAYVSGYEAGRADAMKEVEGLVEAVDAFITKTQEVSKVTRENPMYAPEEYVGMLKALVEYRKGRV